MTAKRLFRDLNSKRLMFEFQIHQKKDLPPYLKSAWNKLEPSIRSLYINKANAMNSKVNTRIYWCYVIHYNYINSNFFIEYKKIPICSSDFRIINKIQQKKKKKKH